jgi:hypothetical protein
MNVCAYAYVYMNVCAYACVCIYAIVNPLTPDLNPTAQRCLTKFFTGDFAS